MLGGGPAGGGNECIGCGGIPGIAPRMGGGGCGGGIASSACCEPGGPAAKRVCGLNRCDDDVFDRFAASILEREMVVCTYMIQREEAVQRFQSTHLVMQLLLREVESSVGVVLMLGRWVGSFITNQQPISLPQCVSVYVRTFPRPIRASRSIANPSCKQTSH